MTDHLEQQLVNELRALLQGVNERYGEFFHVNLLTLVDMKEESCEPCKKTGSKCLRCVVAVQEKGNNELG